MSAGTVIEFTTRREWVPVEHCDRCGEARPADHACLIRLETSHG